MCGRLSRSIITCLTAGIYQIVIVINVNRYFCSARKFDNFTVLGDDWLRRLMHG